MWAFPDRHCTWLKHIQWYSIWSVCFVHSHPSWQAVSNLIRRWMHVWYDVNARFAFPSLQFTLGEKHHGSQLCCRYFTKICIPNALFHHPNRAINAFWSICAGTTLFFVRQWSKLACSWRCILVSVLHTVWSSDLSNFFLTSPSKNTNKLFVSMVTSSLLFWWILFSCSRHLCSSYSPWS